MSKGYKLKHLSLFSGIGGFDLGLEATGGFETTAFCEFDKKAQEILRLRWPGVPIFDDIRGINEETIKGESEHIACGVDIITGGFPCQPFSVAGKRGGTEDNRYLWPELLRVIQLFKPTWCILENVRGLLTIEDGVVFGNCLSDLETSGYEHQTLVIPACAKNAQHRRDRIWIICHAKHNGQPASKVRESTEQGNDRGKAGKCKTNKSQGSSEQRSSVADTNTDNAQGEFGGSLNEKDRRIQGERQTRSCSNGERRGGETQSRLGRELDGLSSWLDEQGLPKVSKGVPRRVDRLKQLGNSIVPQIAYEIGRAILDADGIVECTEYASNLCKQFSTALKPLIQLNLPEFINNNENKDIAC